MLEKEVKKILHLMYSMDRITKWALKLSKNILHTKGQNQFRQWRELAICFANLARKTQINDSTFNMYAYKGACISIYERTARFELCLFCYGFQGWISLKVFFFVLLFFIWIKFWTAWISLKWFVKRHYLLFLWRKIIKCLIREPQNIFLFKNIQVLADCKQ